MERSISSSSDSDYNEEFVTIDHNYDYQDFEVRDTSPVPSLHEETETNVDIVPLTPSLENEETQPEQTNLQTESLIDNSIEQPNAPVESQETTSMTDTTSTDSTENNAKYTEPEELNFLIIGETGVGKSTWINSTANYIVHENISSALFGKEIALIPSKFIITDDNLEERVVEVGSSDNEVTTTGHSATQSTKAYLLNWNDSKGQPHRIRLIDTPGIGDVRGPDYDKMHMANILMYLSTLTALHGICILLPPNNARLTLIFQYCLNELLTHLHKNAANNIVFVFTNARSANFRPGNTMPILRDFLKQIEEKQSVRIPTVPDTVYCLDNEAYRYICASRQGIDFDEDEQDNYRRSWDRSKRETNRMFEHIATRIPHAMTETMTLNDARRLILTLAKPLADITSNIQTNMCIISERKRMLETHDQKEGDLVQQLMVPMVSIEVEQLGHPRTVCTAANCIEVKNIANSNSAETIYKTHCHPHCYLKNVVTEVVPEPGLRKCKAMGGKENCQVCGCRWNQHMHITYGQHQKKTEIKDAEIERMIQENADQKDIIITAIKRFEQFIKELELEQKVITKNSVKFGIFLKNNAILPYNDVFEDYVNHAIKEEERVAVATRNEVKLDKLKRMLDEYKEERQILEESMSASGEEIRPPEIGLMNYELINLKHKGLEIARMLGVALEAQDRMLHHQERAISLPHNEPPPPYSPSNSRSRVLLRNLLALPSSLNNNRMEHIRSIFGSMAIDNASRSRSLGMSAPAL